jgi:hypothetical protein
MICKMSTDRKVSSLGVVTVRARITDNASGDALTSNARFALWGPCAHSSFDGREL